MKAQVIRGGPLDRQVCVPAEWSDERVERFTNKTSMCGTDGGWKIRKTGSELLKGDPERVPCSDRPGFVHIMLDA